MSELSLSELMGRHRVRGIIALKGLPCTCKTEVGDGIGRWAKCPVLCIDDCLGGAGDTGYSEPDFSPPTSPDQVERHHRHAFAALLKVAHHQLRRGLSNCVVVKSRLNTTNDLQQLLHLSTIPTHRYRSYECRVVIVECRIRNEYLRKKRFHECYSDGYWSPNYSRQWYKARSWKDVEKARDDYAAAQSQAWDLHLQQLFNGPAVKCLVVDPFNHLFCRTDRIEEDRPLPAEFTNAIQYLLTANKQELNKQNPHVVVEYDQLRRYLFEKELSDAESKPRSESHCHGDCVFKYHQHYEAHFCHVCTHQVSGPAYTCYFCVATLHKSCAQGIHNINALLEDTVLGYFADWRIPDRFPEKRPCKACTQGGRDFSEECRSCLFHKCLKCHLLPTILNHNFHHHFLSIHLHLDNCVCKACGDKIYNSFSYGCKRCASHYHLYCAFLPLELKHKHGGYNHTMKLMHSHDGLEQEEDYWCDACYEDMDPQLWFYACQECPNYVAHLYNCSGGFRQRFDNLKDVKYVEQVQSQLEEAIAGIGAVRGK